MSWTIAYYRAALQRELLSLPATLQARYIHLTARMQVFGPDLGMPHTRAMGEGLFELRLKGAEGIARVLYCTLAGRRIVMLHQFMKKSEKNAGAGTCGRAPALEGDQGCSRISNS